jgi:hypothetical protein
MTRLTKDQYINIMMNKKSKFWSVKTNWYDSKKENKRAYELSLLQKAGVISELQEQVKFTLLEWFLYKWEKIRWISYIADFVYKNKELETIVEDVKSEFTKKLPVYIIKKKLLLSKNPNINFIET